MNIIKKLFSGVNTQYLVKSYFFSILITALFFFSGAANSAFLVIYVLICGLLFPFASVVWDDLVSTIMGNNVIYLALPIMLIWKIFKLLMLYVFTPLIAPVGFIYIYIANGYHRKA